MKKFGLLLVTLMFAVSFGCKPPAVTEPDPAGFKAPERLEAQAVGAGSGGAPASGAKRGSGPPTETQSAEVD